MKFGRKFHKRQVAEWADAYMKYSTFKRLCKESIERSDLQELAASCMVEIHSVDQFYHDNFAILHMKLSTEARHQHTDPNLDLNSTTYFIYELDHVELQHYKVALVVLVADFDKLRWYGRVNTDGFRKIIQKIRLLGTKGSQIAAQAEETLSKVEFATQASCLSILDNLHKDIARSNQEVVKNSTPLQHNFCTRIAKINPSISAFAIFRAIESDNSVELGNLVENACGGDLDFSRLEFLHVLSECSVRFYSKPLIDILISAAISLDAVEVIENCIRRVIVELGHETSNEQQATPSGYDTSISLLSYMLDRLLARKLNLLYKQDSLGRTPLHYACEHGLAEVSHIILNSLKACEMFGAENIGSVVFLEDIQLRNPLKLSVLGNHLEVMRMLINFYGQGFGSGIAALFLFNEPLLLAVKLNFTEALALLLETDVDINCCNALGQTPLYLAAQSGNETMVDLLLHYKPLIDKHEIVNNWTPLIIACLEGFSTIAEVLLKHGANIEHSDRSGWAAIDHDGYQGHIPLAKALSKASGDLSNRQATEIHRQITTSSEQRISVRGQPRRTILETESHIVVNLGSLDSSKITPAVSLSPHMIEKSLLKNPESLFSLGVLLVGTASPSCTIPLPLLEDVTSIPWIFTTIDPTNAKLAFEIYDNEPATIEGRRLVGRGMAFLESYTRSLYTKRESLSRDCIVPILSTNNWEYIGAVAFSFLVSTPLVLPNTPPVDTEALWFEQGPSKVVGHRGLGQNVLPATRLQIGENSIQSFLSAVDLGAPYVELDVQLTKDHVPVIYHDFLVSETGIDAPMYALTYEKFMHINNQQSDQRLSTSPKEMTVPFKTPLSKRVRTLSSSTCDGVQTEPFMARVKHTFDYNSRGFKGNTRGGFIHESFITLEKLLKSIPLNIGMDIEIKYPMLSEATDDWKMDPFYVEANFFTDTILLCLANHISTRSILICSFSPEICILLALKQSRWPIIFGNDSGNWKSTDIRATNLQEGLRFARKWDLDGLALASEPLVFAPQLVGFVKRKGMVCATYGVLNGYVEGVAIQTKAGVDVIIVNNVRLVSETLAAL